MEFIVEIKATVNVTVRDAYDEQVAMAIATDRVREMYESTDGITVDLVVGNLENLSLLDN